MAGNNATRKDRVNFLRKSLEELNQRKVAVLAELKKIADASHEPECKMNCCCGKEQAVAAIKELGDSQTS